MWCCGAASQLVKATKARRQRQAAAAARPAGRSMRHRIWIEAASPYCVMMAASGPLWAKAGTELEAGRQSLRFCGRCAACL